MYQAFYSYTNAEGCTVDDVQNFATEAEARQWLYNNGAETNGEIWFQGRAVYRPED